MEFKEKKIILLSLDGGGIRGIISCVILKYIEDKLKEICDIPVCHDDQHGTAIACLSAVLGALRFVKKDIARLLTFSKQISK